MRESLQLFKYKKTTQNNLKRKEYPDFEQSNGICTAMTVSLNEKKEAEQGNKERKWDIENGKAAKLLQSLLKLERLLQRCLQTMLPWLEGCPQIQRT